MENIQDIPLDQIDVEGNVRTHYNQRTIEELGQNMKVVGQIEPAIVTKKEDGRFRLIIGGRRYRAAIHAEIPHLSCVVRELNDNDIEELQLSENLQREAMTPLEECDTFHLLMKKKRYTMQDCADRCGVSTDHVFGRLSLIALVEEGKKFLNEEILTVSTAIKIATLLPKVQSAAIRVLVNPMVVGEETRYVFAGPKAVKTFFDNSVFMPIAKADFDPNEEKLFKCGSCKECPKRSSNSQLFKDISIVDSCTDFECFHDKHVTHYQHLQTTLKKSTKVEVGFAARVYDADKQYKDLGEVLTMFDYVAIDEKEAKKDKLARLVIFVGISTGESSLKSSWVKITKKGVEKEEKKVTKAEKEKEKKKVEKESLIEKHLRFHLYEDFIEANHAPNFIDRSLREIVSYMIDELKFVGSAVICDFVKRHTLSIAIQFQGANQEWVDVVLDKKYKHDPEAGPISISQEAANFALTHVPQKRLLIMLSELSYMKYLERLANVDIEVIRKEYKIDYSVAKKKAASAAGEELKAKK